MNIGEMRKLFLIPFVLMAAFVATASCSKGEPSPDRQEQPVPEGDGWEDARIPDWLEELGTN